MPANSVRELIALAKAQPGKLNYASNGNGSSSHLAAVMFASMTGIDIVHVPYKGLSPALADLLGGQVQMMFSSVVAILPHVKAGKLRALAVSSRERMSLLPDLPTIAESGVPGYQSSSWYGILAPAGTPPEVVARLNAALVKVVARADVRDALAKEGAEPVGNSPEAFGAFIRAEKQRLGDVIRQAKVPMQVDLRTSESNIFCRREASCATSWASTADGARAGVQAASGSVRMSSMRSMSSSSASSASACAKSPAQRRYFSRRPSRVQRLARRAGKSSCARTSTRPSLSVSVTSLAQPPCAPSSASSRTARHCARTRGVGESARAVRTAVHRVGAQRHRDAVRHAVLRRHHVARLPIRVLPHHLARSRARRTSATSSGAKPCCGAQCLDGDERRVGRHVTRVALDAELARLEALAEACGEQRGVALGAIRLEEAEAAFEDRVGPFEALLRQARREDARFGGATEVQALDHRAVVRAA